MGFQKGNQLAAGRKPWAEALKRINVQTDGAKLRAIAEKLYAMAAAGDIQAIKEIAERHDGKSAQSMELMGEGGGPLQFQEVIRKIVDSRNPDA